MFIAQRLVEVLERAGREEVEALRVFLQVQEAGGETVPVEEVTPHVQIRMRTVTREEAREAVRYARRQGEAIRECCYRILQEEEGKGR